MPDWYPHLVQEFIICICGISLSVPWINSLVSSNVNCNIGNENQETAKHSCSQ